MTFEEQVRTEQNEVFDQTHHSLYLKVIKYRAKVLQLEAILAGILEVLKHG